jgi:hypothetical protein
MAQDKTARIEAWTSAGEPEIILAGSYSEAFARADFLGAIRIVDGLGTIFRKIAGEWVSIP